METRKDGHIVWEKVHRSHETCTLFERVAGLDAICFNDKATMKDSPQIATDIYGDIYALKVNDDIVGYAIYGQVWLPELPDAYISRIGVSPRLPTTRVRAQDTRSNPL